MDVNRMADATQLFELFMKMQSQLDDKRREEDRLRREEERLQKKEEAELQLRRELEFEKLRIQREIEAKRLRREKKERSKAQQLYQDTHARRLEEERGRSLSRGKSKEARQQDLDVIQQVQGPSAIIPYYCSEMAQKAFPLYYQQVSNLPNYNQTQWSYSIKSRQPYYVVTGALAQAVVAAKVVLTQQVLATVVGNIAQHEKEILSPQANITTIHTRYLDLISKHNTVEYETINETVQKDATMRQITNTLKHHPVNPMLAPDTAEITANSIFYDPTSYTAEVYHQWDLNTNIWFNGALKRDTYRLKPTIDQLSTEAFAKATQDVIFQHIANDLSRSSVHTPQYPKWYTLRAYYISRDDPRQFRNINVWSGVPTTKEQIQLEHLTEDFKDTLSNMHYEGSQVHGQFELDYSRFDIVTIDITRTAGNEQDFLLLNEWVRSNNTGKLQMSWGTIEMNSVKNEECFLKVLSDHLKQWQITKGRPYHTLAKYQLGLVRGAPTSTQNAIAACDILGIKLFIHNIDGEVVYQGTGQSQAQNPFPQLLEIENKDLHVLMHDGHYMRIVGNIRKPLPKVVHIPPTKQEDDFQWWSSTCYFDIETVTDEVQAIPYSISYALGEGEIHFESTPNPSLTIFDGMLAKLREMGPGYRHVCIAYNGSNFDFLPLYRYLLEKHYSVVQAANPSGKGQTFTVRVATAKSQEWINQQPEARRVFLAKQYSLLTVWDPLPFVNKSLAVAARDFGLNITKGDIDHEKVQQSYARNKLHKWLEKNEKELREYNDRDVELLRELVKRLLTVLEKITGFKQKEIMSTPSISALAYKLFNHLLDTAADKTFVDKKTWKESTRRKKLREHRQNYPRPQTVISEELDKLIRKSATAGRVQGEVGYRKQLSVIVDVVSLYPTAMLLNQFPAGQEFIRKRKDFESYVKLVETFEEIVDSEEQCVMMRVVYDQSTMTTPHPVLPVRVEGKPLDWHTFSEGEELLPLVTIRQLLKYGATVYVPDSVDEEEVMLVMWDNAPYFAEYISKLSAMKNEQDKLKEEGSSQYNPTLREMVKMLLNGLSGKMIQKNHENKFELASDDLVEKLEEVINNEKLVGEEVIETIQRIKLDVISLTTRHAYVTWKGSGWSAGSKPSHVGVFIYAYARAYMFEHVMSKMKVWYTDTDSALITVEDFAKLDPALLCATVDKNTMRVTQTREKKFGDFEVEKVCDSFIVVAPKTYCLINDGKVVKNGIKGVRKTDQFLVNDVELKTVGENLLELYQLLLHNKEIQLTTGATPKVEITAFQVRRKWKEAGLHYLRVRKYI